MTDLPGPKGTIRPLLQFNADPAGWLRRMHLEHGDAFAFRFGKVRLASVLDADRVSQILLNRDRAFLKDHFTRELKVLTGDGLLTSEGPVWRGHRKLVAPTLKRGHIRHYADIFVRHTRRWIDDADARVDLHHEMMDLTLDLVAEALFATTEGAGVADLGESLEKAMRAYVRHERTPLRVLPAWFPGSPAGTMKRMGDFVASHIDGLIAARRERPAGDDLLWRLIEARDDEGAALDAIGLRDEAATLFLAGHETTALTMTFAWYWLGAHPEAAERVYAEVDAVLGERPATADDMPALKACEATIKESMRLSPPAWVIGRESQRDVEVGGYTIPAGTQVLVPITAMHLDTRRFDDPESFRIERWLGEDAIKPGRWDYMPFGGGERICVGNHFAMMEAVLMLATMVQGARFELERPEPPKIFYSITQRPLDGMPARLTRR